MDYYYDLHEYLVIYVTLSPVRNDKSIKFSLSSSIWTRINFCIVVSDGTRNVKVRGHLLCYIVYGVKKKYIHIGWRLHVIRDEQHGVKRRERLGKYEINLIRNIL